MNALVGAITLFLLNMIAVGIGLPVLRWVLGREDLRLEHLLASLAVGMGIIGTLVLFLGLVGGLYVWAAWVFVVVLLACALPGLRRVAGEWGRGVQPAMPQLSTVGWVMLFFIALHALMNLAVALTPPTEADTLIYHLLLPKKYVEAHRIYFMGESYFATMGYLMECLYTLGLLVGSDRLPALLQFEFGLLTATLIALCARRWFGLRDSLVPAAIFYCMPITAVSSTSAMVEMAAVFYSLLGVFFAIEFLQGGDRKRLVTAGICVGLTAAIKLLGFLTCAGLLVVVFVGSMTMLKRGKRAIVDAAIPAAVALAVVSPWLLRNLVWCGNPFFPELYGLFGASHWNDYSHSVVAEIHRGYAGRYAGRPFFGLFTALWRLTNFTEPGRSVSSSVGPLYVALLPFCVWAAVRSCVARMLFVFAVLYYIMWYYTAPYVDLHHLMPALPALALIGAAGLSASSLCRGRLKIVPTGFVVVALLYSYAVTAIYAAQFAPYVFGRTGRDDLLRRTTWYYDDIVWMNRNLGKEDKVAMAVAPTYYLDIPHIHLAPYRQGWIDFSKVHGAGEVAQALRRKGVTHVFVVMNSLSDDMVRSLPTLGPYVDAMRRFVDSPHVFLVHINPFGQKGSRKPAWARGRRQLWETRVYKLAPDGGERPATEAQ
ncbi:MAG: hypothetical protein GXP25_21680 [Planctomycetes bacterium]|nr:hypothetical protein [Planctomycetota bacterium]